MHARLIYYLWLHFKLRYKGHRPHTTYIRIVYTTHHQMNKCQYKGNAFSPSAAMADNGIEHRTLLSLCFLTTGPWR